MISKILTITLLIIKCLNLHSQTLTKEYIRDLQVADEFFYYTEEYEKAGSLYKILCDQYPENSNLASKLGICYLNIDGKKDEALVLLKKASKSVVNSDIDYIEYGEVAPMDTYFYLAYAYHLNDSLEKAVQLYTEVKKAYNASQAFRVDYIDNQIKACRYAMEQQKNPIGVSASLFTSWLKDFPGACNPVISDNDSVFIFTVKAGDNTKMFCSNKGSSWEKPVEITSQLGGYENMYSNSVTGNGKMLIIYMEDKGDGNLFYSLRNGKEWSKIKKFGKEINSKYWESHGAISPDGKKLFVTSNRPGGAGELDIYITEVDSKGNWGPLTNVGRVINTLYNENTPYFDQQNYTLYFSSNGLLGMGDYDLFSSTFKSGRWSKPLGFPYPINNTTENLFFLSNLDGTDYITSFVDDKQGVRNIYKLKVTPELSDKTIVTGGSIYLQDGMILNPEAVEVLVSNVDSAGVWNNIEVSNNGEFSFVAKPGDYQVQVSHEGYKTDTIDLDIPDTFTSPKLELNSTLIPEKVTSGQFYSIKNILFDYNSFSLNSTAIAELEKLKSILTSLEIFTLEIGGYTDSKGSQESNIILAERRAQTVIDYLTDSGIDSDHFVKKAIGADEYVAVNANADGSDNPEGRKYNRRVTIGMIDPASGITIQPESYTPSHLRNPFSLRYSIVLLKSEEKFYPDYFRNLKTNDLIFVRPIQKDSLYLYVLGEFAEKSDALSYLKTSVDNGFADAYIVNQYDLTSDVQGATGKQATERGQSPKLYTIQLRASRKQLTNNTFNSLKDVKEIVGIDGYYRYVYGEYKGFSLAKKALEGVNAAGFKDAFIREYNLLLDQKINP